MSSDPPIDEIRRVRHEISAACEHDPKKLVAYYQELQGQFQSKVINIGAQQSVILKGLSVSPNEGSPAPQA
jgi:hypothetical protein